MERGTLGIRQVEEKTAAYDSLCENKLKVQKSSPKRFVWLHTDGVRSCLIQRNPI
jgi:hypothetical protein